MPQKPISNLAWVIFPFFILTGIASFTEPNTSIWFKILMGIAVLLSVFALGERIYFYFKSGKPISEAFMPKKNPNGTLIISIIYAIAGIYCLIYKSLPIWLFIALIFCVIGFSFNAGKILYKNFKNKN